MNLKDSKYIFITDIGSTTTKALLLSNENGKFTFKAELDVPTTVEKPNEDVKIGVMNALKELEKRTNIKLIDNLKNEIMIPYITTSSAGGGLQILVFGISQTETGRVAQMTAYGAGGVVLHTFTIDDHIAAIDKMRLIRELHPDLILMAGGIDGGAISGVIRLAELLSLAEPSAKFHQSMKIPLIFCGNITARELVKGVLEDKFELHIVDNVRPNMEKLNIIPAKNKIHQLFMENVMERAPGYTELKKWVKTDIIPTPTGVENMLRLYGAEYDENILMVDIGGATTDIFSNILDDYYRTVAANIGMSYSISNILAEAGIEKISRHLPSNFDEIDIRNYISNKMLNPTYTPKFECEKRVEQAVAIEGINIAWRQHINMNYNIIRIGFLDRMKKREDIDPFQELLFGKYDKKSFHLSDIGLIIGAGGVISHLENEEEALWILTEGFKPLGVTLMAIDKSFKSPHLGILSNIDKKLALELFERECLKFIGYVVAPWGKIEIMILVNLIH